jgi:hypothetical protein
MNEELKIMGIRDWRRYFQDRDKWRAMLKEKKVRDGLQGK